jgi:hypothetical protein
MQGLFQLKNYLKFRFTAVFHISTHLTEDFHEAHNM